MGFIEPGLDVGVIHLTAPVGIGTNKWGVDPKKFDTNNLSESYTTALANNINFFNTAQLYNGGESEQCLGKFRATAGGKGLICSKFASLKSGPEKLVTSLRESLARCQLDVLDAFLIHHPAGDLAKLADQLAICVKDGLCKTVGVSNFNEKQLRRFHELLAERGVSLLFNEIEFSLLRRKPDTNGLLAACKELGVTVLAWAPLASGRLTGKHAAQQNSQCKKLLNAMASIAERYKKTPAAVAINWCICKGTVPIPGARTRVQAEENCSAIGWRLSAEEVRLLDSLAVDDSGMFTNPEAVYTFLGFWPHWVFRPIVSRLIWFGLALVKRILPLQDSR